MQTVHVLHVALGLAMCPFPLLHAVAPPGILNHQGRIAVSGENYTGAGHFKFALVDAAGTTTLWSNNGTGTGGGQPTAAVQVAVSQGHYALGLGDTTLANMTDAIPASVFTGNADVRLRVWFSTNGTAFEQLTPDRRITAAAYALTAGAVADPSFLGTTGNTPLDLSVNGVRGLRLQYAVNDEGQSVNVIGGLAENVVASGVGGATIAGGGVPGFPNKVTGNFGTIGGGAKNTAGYVATVGGGSFNTAGALGAAVGGGTLNEATGESATVGGGYGNKATGYAATIPGGEQNEATDQAFAAGRGAKANHSGSFVWADAIGGIAAPPFTSTATNQFLIRAEHGVGINKNNPAVALDVNGTVRATAFEGMGATLLLGTTDNQPLDLSVNNQRALRLQPGGFGGTPNLIGGDAANSIAANAFGSVIGGGGNGGANSITASTVNAVIAGGKNNIASENDTFIGGGANNRASGAGAAVAGGNTNVASGRFSAVGGGQNNSASGTYSFAAGRRAAAGNEGAFVWADSQDAAFSSTANDQFNVRAGGGARLFTGGTGLQLDSDSVVFSGSAQTGRFGRAAAFDFNTGASASSSGLLIEQGLSETSGLFFDGDSITMWSPGDNSGGGARLLRILDTDSMNVGAAAAERFYVDGTGGVGCAGSAAIAGGATIAGQVGIGTTTPDRPLTIQGTGGNSEWLSFKNASGTTKWHLNNFNGGFNFSETGVADNRLFLRAGGNVGIGTLTPGFNLEVNGSAGKPGGGAWSVASDARLKKNIEDLHGSLDRLLRLRSVSFEYKDPKKGAGPQIGFIAQEVQRVLPQWVTEGPEGMLAVSVTGFESLAVDALRELRTEKDQQIAELKTENTGLRTESATLKARLDRLERAVEMMQRPAAASESNR